MIKINLAKRINPMDICDCNYLVQRCEIPFPNREPLEMVDCTWCRASYTLKDAPESKAFPNRIRYIPKKVIDTDLGRRILYMRNPAFLDSDS